MNSPEQQISRQRLLFERPPSPIAPTRVLSESGWPISFLDFARTKKPTGKKHERPRNELHKEKSKRRQQNSTQRPRGI